MEREEKQFNLFIGKTTDWEYVFLDSAFNDWERSGITWHTFEFHTEFSKNNEEDSYLYSDDWEYLFCEYIKYSHDHDTTFNEWVEIYKEEHPNGASFDESYYDEEWLREGMDYASNEEDLDFEFSDCRSGGRIFDEWYIKKENYEYLIEDNFNVLVDCFNKYEKRITWKELEETNKD